MLSTNPTATPIAKETVAMRTAVAADTAMRGTEWQWEGEWVQMRGTKFVRVYFLFYSKLCVTLGSLLRQPLESL